MIAARSQRSGFAAAAWATGAMAPAPALAFMELPAVLALSSLAGASPLVGTSAASLPWAGTFHARDYIFRPGCCALLLARCMLLQLLLEAAL